MASAIVSYGGKLISRIYPGGESQWATKQIPPPHYWMDFPSEWWLAQKLNWTHAVGCAFATFLYIVPGLIFLVAKLLIRRSYLKKAALAQEAQDYAYEHTGCDALGSVLHLGGHPLLPYQQRILLGFKGSSLGFYSYDLTLLHSLPVSEVQVAAETRHVRTTSYGTLYKPTDSSFGSTSSTQQVDLHPDTLRMGILVNGQRCVAEFDTRPGDPLEVIQVLNQVRVGSQ